MKYLLKSQKKKIKPKDSVTEQQGQETVRGKKIPFNKLKSCPNKFRTTIFGTSDVKS